MKEYGGYLHLELNCGKEYYDGNNYAVRRYNSGRSAIYKAIQDFHAKKIWLPVYLCPSVEQFLKNFNVEISHYNIDSDFMPINIDKKNRDIILYVNYFGLQNIDKLNKIKYDYENVIFDNTQAFFHPPISNAYNVYSCRKFLGVCDGAYLINDNFLSEDNENLKISETYKTSNYLLKAIDLSTNEAYEDSLNNEYRIEHEGVRSMSNLTKYLLSNCDYENYKRIRINNYQILLNQLESINELKCHNVTFAPMIYPLLINDNGLRRYLLSNKVYIPQLWKVIIDNPLANDFEIMLSKYLMPLPIDQRYSSDDMNYLIDIIKQYIY